MFSLLYQFKQDFKKKKKKKKGNIVLQWFLLLNKKLKKNAPSPNNTPNNKELTLQDHPPLKKWGFETTQI